LGYFAAVLVGLAVASTWVSGCVLAFVGVFAYSAAALFTWPLLDAAFSRYSREPIVSAAAERIHWVVAVLLGVLLSILVGVLAGC
jgi:hypothetical protein